MLESVVGLAWLLDLSAQFWQGICGFFLNNTSEVHKELLVRCPETIQHICMNIGIFNKTIIFTWLTKIIQILGVRPKLLGSGNHAKPKRLGLTTLCKCVVDHDTVHCRLAQWIFQTLKDNIVFLYKVKLLFYLLVKKLSPSYGYGNVLFLFGSSIHIKPKLFRCQIQIPWS